MNIVQMLPQPLLILKHHSLEHKPLLRPNKCEVETLKTTEKPNGSHNEQHFVDFGENKLENSRFASLSGALPISLPSGPSPNRPPGLMRICSSSVTLPINKKIKLMDRGRRHNLLGSFYLPFNYLYSKEVVSSLFVCLCVITMKLTIP